MKPAHTASAHDGAQGPSSSMVIELQARLREAEETLDAIRNGDVDAIVVGGADGQKVYTLENADRPYRVLIEQMQEGAVTLSEDGTVLYCNQRFVTLVGMRREALIGNPVSRFIRVNERDSFHVLLTHDGSIDSAEFTLLTAGQVEVPVNISLVNLRVEEQTPRILCGVITDLTNSRKRSHELAAANTRLASEIEERRRAEDSLHLALEAAGMGNWDLDVATGNARRSARHDEIFGHFSPLPAWSLQLALDQFVPDDRAAVVEAFINAEQTGWIEFEKRIWRANDHAVRWVHVKGRTHYQDGKPVRIAGVVTDVTDRRLIEEQLRQAQKMEAIGQLTGGIAHDFNNLLMVIGGNLELLSEQMPGDERTARLFTAARHGVERGAKLNQQLLAFSRRQDLRLEVVCVDALISSFRELIDRAVGESISVVLEHAPQLWFCRTDSHQLETAILNLAINARDAMPQGGVLTLSVGLREVDEKKASALGTACGDYVVVSISDTGGGIAPEIMTRVYEPFFTTKEVGKGTGLGLSQVYGFAKQSNGFVTIESELLHGTRVLIHLPRTSQPESLMPAKKTGGSEVKGQGVVLVVEDDPDVRATTCIMLQDLGYSVREADAAVKALGIIETGEPIDLVFSDVIMPGGMTGIELAKELKKRCPDLPVLLTSGYTARHFVTQTVTEDLRLLRKPYTMADLSKAVKNALS